MRKTKLYQSCHASRPRSCRRSHRRRGITSACAEQTHEFINDSTAKWDHLRVCGADGKVQDNATRDAGSPPRVRSRPTRRLGIAGRMGITSACAEQTLTSSTCPLTPWDHLRVCGADVPRCAMYQPTRGSPPRVRSRLLLAFDDLGDVGITSACAEQTRTPRPRTCPAGDYLRVCGADEVGVGAAFAFAGSPPRVRSRLLETRGLQSAPGITSACAEQTTITP